MQSCGVRHPNRISLLEPHEVQYWSDKFGVSKERLSEAVRNVGHSAAAVEKHPVAGQRWQRKRNALRCSISDP